VLCFIVVFSTYCVVLYSGVVFFFVFVVFSMLPVSLDCPFFIPRRYSLTFIYMYFLLFFPSKESKW